MEEQTKLYSQMRSEFYAKYQQTIVPIVRQFDKERKIKLIIAIISVLACCSIGSYFLYLAFISEFSTYVFISSLLELVLVSTLYWYFIKKGYKNKIKAMVCLIILLFILGVSNNVPNEAFKPALVFFLLSGFLWGMIKKGFESKIKKQMMPTVCSCFPELTWSETFYTDEYVLKASGVVPHYNHDRFDDIFTGSHKDVNMEIVESELEVRGDKNGYIVFKGVIIKLNMNKIFTSHTVITPDKMFHLSPVKGLRHTTLEDVKFEKKFDVYTNDEVDARYLITPTFMERLKGIKTAFKADKIQCAFYNQYLLIALSTDKDLFSLCSLVKPMDDPKQYFQMYEEIISIIKLIDHFKLDQKIGL